MGSATRPQIEAVLIMHAPLDIFARARRVTICVADDVDFNDSAEHRLNILAASLDWRQAFKAGIVDENINAGELPRALSIWHRHR